MTPNIEISTAVGCKMRCDYCPQKIHVKNYSEKNDQFNLTFENFRTCLNKIPKHVEIYFAGMAEPWLNRSCTKMIIYAHNHGYKIGVYTTAFGMTIEDVQIISHIPFIHFCLHIPDEAGRMNLEITEDYLKVLKACVDLIPNRNFMLIGDMDERIQAVIGHEVGDSSRGLFSRAGNLKGLIIPKKTGKLQCSACGPKIDHNILLPNGEVLLCCMDYAQKHVIGNLLHMEYEDLFKSAEYLKVMDGLSDDSADILCRRCEVSEKIN